MGVGCADYLALQHHSNVKLDSQNKQGAGNQVADKGVNEFLPKSLLSLDE